MEQIVQLNSQAKLSEHLASPSEATLGHSNKLDGSHLSPHFTLGEMTKSNSHPEVYNIPSHEAIANLKRVCGWLEVLRKRYNERYVVNRRDFSTSLEMTGGGTLDMTTAPVSSRLSEAHGEISEKPIIINSGYRSPQLNKKIGGVAGSNHLTGCAVDIRVLGMEQLIRYATILLDYADESKQDFDELLIERNRYGAIWLHFAVRPFSNRHKVSFINA
jgi:hypothetical protein